MANIKSQIKRIGTNKKAEERNKAVKSELKTAVRRTREAIAAGDKAKAEAALATATKKLDKRATVPWCRRLPERGICAKAPAAELLGRKRRCEAFPEIETDDGRSGGFEAEQACLSVATSPAREERRAGHIGRA